MNQLLEARKIVKSSKPKNFLRTDTNKERFKNKWRKPRGLHNKRRLSKKGHQKNPSQGYRSPVLVRSLTKSGLNPIVINNLQDLLKVDNKKDIAILGKKVGTKKRILILEESKKLNIKFENVKDVNKFIADSIEKFQKRKEESNKKKQAKEKSKKESEKKAEEKQKESTEEKKEDSKEKLEKVKEEVLHAQKKQPDIKQKATKPTMDTKIGHKQSSVPGTKQ